MSDPGQRPVRPTRRRPSGQPTRGKTALNRLRQIDVYVALAHTDVLSSTARDPSPLVVDLGFGAQAWTTLEMRTRWLPINPRLRVVGIEIDPARVAEALPYADPPAVEFKVGGFNVADVIGHGTARLIRAYNVLRQYEENAVAPALAEMAEALTDGGLLIEGTSNPTGRIVAFDVYRRDGAALRHMALVFGTNFRAPVEPAEFQTILPKRLIHHMLDPEPAAFFAAWQRAYALTRGPGSARLHWQRAARHLRSQGGYPVDPRPRLLRRGFLPLYADLRG